MKSEIKLPECLSLKIVAKWLDGDQHKFKLCLINSSNGQKMGFDYSGGSMAFLPDKFPAEMRTALIKPVRTLHDEQQKGMALQEAHRLAKPDLAGVLYSLISDSQAGSETFKSFCDEFGYDSDSRSAFATWEKCVEIAGDFKRVSGDLLPELEELLQDY